MVRRIVLSLVIVAAVVSTGISQAEARPCAGGGYGGYRSAHYYGGPSYYNGSHYGRRSHYNGPRSYYGGQHGYYGYGGHSGASFSIGF